MQSNSLAALLNTDIPDPTDFDSPPLRQLDSALRCTICTEWFDAPVALACGHCFCSLCARNYINDKSECPSCRKTANEGHLRVNPVMEEVVSAWKLARPIILELSKAERSTDTRPRSKASKKRKRNTQEWKSSDDEIEYIPGPSISNVNNKKKTRSPPSSPARRGRKGSGDDADDRIDDADDEEANGGDGEEAEDVDDDGQSVIPTSDSREEELEHENDDDNNNAPSSSSGLVTCPLCSDRVKFKSINAHIDNGCRLEPLLPNGNRNGSGKRKYKSSADVKGQWNKIMSGTGGGGEGGTKTNARTKAKGKEKEKEKETDNDDRHPLPKASYAVLKDRQLKNMLLEYNLPVTGDRNGWIARHSRWVMTYNANLDKSVSQRKSLAELRAELRKWEEVQRINGAKKQRERVGGGVGGGGEDTVKYEKANKTEFARLVAVARGSVATKGTGAGTGTGEGASESPSASKPKPGSKSKTKPPSSTASTSGSRSRSNTRMMVDGIQNSHSKSGDDDDGSNRDDAIVVDSEEEWESVTS